MNQTYSLYNGEVTVEFNDGSHRYKVNGEYKPGVTTALAILAKDNLIQWASNKAVEAFRLAYADKPWDKDEFEAVCAQAKYAHRTLKDDAAIVGKNVHQWVSDHIKGTDTPYEEIMRPSIEAFLKWEEANKPDYLFSERILYSRQHNYCGTVDIGMKLNGQRTIVDLKTGKPEQEYKKTYTGRQRGRSEHFLQNGAYDQALGEEDGVFADAVGVIYLPLDGSIHVYSHTDTDFWRRGWLTVLNAYRYLKAANDLNEWSNHA